MWKSSAFDRAKATHFHSPQNWDDAVLLSERSEHALKQASAGIPREAWLLIEEAPPWSAGPPHSAWSSHLQHEPPWELVRDAEFPVPSQTY